VLTEQPIGVSDETRVIVTFLEVSYVDLQSRGIDKSQAAALRERLASFAEEWDSPEMAAYDNYDAARADL
jgi:hypothetical protein